MNLAAIPDDGEFFGQMTLKLFEEANGVDSLNVFIVWEEEEVEARALLLRTKGDSTNGRYFATPFTTTTDGGFTPGGEGSSNGGSQAKA